MKNLLKYGCYTLLCAVIGYSISYVCIKAFDNHEKEIEFLRLR